MSGPAPGDPRASAAQRHDDERRRAYRRRGATYAMGYLAAAPLAVAAGAHRLWMRRRALVGLGEKLFGDGPRVTPGQVVLHGVSLGEVTLMRALAPRLEAALGGRCLLTTTTETGRAGLDKHFPDHERAFLPLDVPWAVNRFLTRARPRLVVLLENEIWPILLCACAARGIPVAVVNARMSERSFRRFAAAGAATRPLFRSLALALAQNGLYAARLARLGVPRDHVRVCGSMKADIVQPASETAARAEAARLGLDPAQPLLLCASTSAPEERPLLESWKRFAADGGWRLVICPRHPERGADLVAQCAALGVAAHRSSFGTTAPADAAVIVDEIGRLAPLYALAQLSGGMAVVGGSLGSGRGGQNMLEAAAAGCCTIVGWDTRNQPDSMQLLRAHGGVVELAPATLDAQLAELAAAPDRRRRLGEAGRRAWATGRGAAERVVAALVGLARG